MVEGPLLLSVLLSMVPAVASVKCCSCAMESSRIGVCGVETRSGVFETGCKSACQNARPDNWNAFESTLSSTKGRVTTYRQPTKCSDFGTGQTGGLVLCTEYFTQQYFRSQGELDPTVPFQRSKLVRLVTAAKARVEHGDQDLQTFIAAAKHKLDSEENIRAMQPGGVIPPWVPSTRALTYPSGLKSGHNGVRRARKLAHYRT